MNTEQQHRRGPDHVLQGLIVFASIPYRCGDSLAVLALRQSDPFAALVGVRKVAEGASLAVRASDAAVDVPTWLASLRLMLGRAS